MKLSEKSPVRQYRCSLVIVVLANTLADKSRDLQKANRQKDEFIMNLSHVLKTPLTVILGWIDLLRSNESAKIDLNKSLTPMKKNGKALLKLIEDLLDTSRIVLGKVAMDRTDCDLLQIVADCVESCQNAAENKKLTLEFESFLKFAPVKADPARLTQIFLNLLSNSLKFTPDCGVINVNISLNNKEFVVQFIDTGIGISPEFLPSVFERMRQEEQSSKKKYGGLGLGLAIAHSLLEMHRGSIHAASAGPGKGATFTVRLPVRHNS